MKPSSRSLLAVSVIAGGVALVCLVIAGFRADEPRYQGKRLSVWFDELAATPPNLSEMDAVADSARRLEMLTNVVRAVGTNALPLYLDWIRESPKAVSGYEEFTEWLAGISHDKIRLPQRQNRAIEAFVAIQILGSTARPAIRPLEQLLQNESTCGIAARSLAAIGADSVPTLAGALSSTNDRVCYSAVRALGDLGAAARPARTALLELVEKPVSSLGISIADLAVRALAEMDPASDEWMPLFHQELFATNASVGAAYGLARSGEAGLPLLSQAITNQDVRIRAGAEAALELSTYAQSKGQTNAVLLFEHFNATFNNRLLRASWSTLRRAP